jgi:hypothetical protein
LVANSGNLTGSYQVTLRIKGDEEEKRIITLTGQSSEMVTFNILRNNPSYYSVDINGLSDSFIVKENPSPALTPNQQSTPSPVPPKPTNWWLVGSIYLADIVLLVIILWLIKRRRQKKEEQLK